MKNLNLVDELYEEICALSNIKGFKDSENNTDEYLLEAVLRVMGMSSIMGKYSLRWSDVDDLRRYYRSLKIGPLKPIMHKPLEHVTYINAADYINGSRQNTIYNTNFEIIRYQDGNGNWVERRAYGDYTLV